MSDHHTKILFALLWLLIGVTVSPPTDLYRSILSASAWLASGYYGLLIGLDLIVALGKWAAVRPPR